MVETPKRKPAVRQERRGPAPTAQYQDYTSRHFLTALMTRLRVVAAVRQQRLQQQHGPLAKVTIETLVNEAVAAGLPTLEKAEGL